MKTLGHAEMGSVLITTALFLGAIACGGESANETVRSTTTLTAQPGVPVEATTTTYLPAQQPQSATPAPPQRETSSLVPSAPAASAPNGRYILGPASSTTGLRASETTSSLNDSEIAELAGDINNGELEQARYAITHAKDARVKAFAQHMLEAHTSIGAKVEAVLKSQNIKAGDSSQSLAFKSEAHGTLAALQGKGASEFDRAYMDAQVTEHQSALDLFDNKLIPNAQNGALKSSLQQARPMIADHLREAKSIQGSLPAM